MSPYRIEEGLIVIEWCTPNGITIIFVFYIKTWQSACTVADKFWISISFLVGIWAVQWISLSNKIRICIPRRMLFELMKSLFVTGGPLPFIKMFNQIPDFPKIIEFVASKSFVRDELDKKKPYKFPTSARLRIGKISFRCERNRAPCSTNYGYYKLIKLSESQVCAPEFKVIALRSGCWLTINWPFTAGAVRPDIVKTYANHSIYNWGKYPH